MIGHSKKKKKDLLDRTGVSKLWSVGKIWPACFYKLSFILRQPYLFLYLQSMAAFVLRWQTGEVVTNPAWPIKAKIFTLRPFTEKVCQLLG